MSGLVMGLVWELPITDDFEKGDKYVLLAYADHADQNGCSIYPSVPLIAKKTGYSDRQVQQITHRLETGGYLVRDGIGRRGTKRWRIPLERREGYTAIVPVFENATGEVASPLDFIPSGEVASPQKPQRGEIPSGEVASPELTTTTTTTTTTGALLNIDERFGELVRLMESITGAVNSATASFLDGLLEDWNEHLTALHPGHPNRLVDAYEAAREAIREAIASAADSRPNHKYIRAIHQRWMREGYKSKVKVKTGGTHASNNSRPAGAPKPAPRQQQPAPVTDASRAAAERINQRRAGSV